MEYKIIIKNGHPCKLEYEPQPVDSKGTYNGKLMEELIAEFGIPGWVYLKNGVIERWYNEMSLTQSIAEVMIKGILYGFIGPSYSLNLSNNTFTDSIYNDP